jgi:hypothetical protein
MVFLHVLQNICFTFSICFLWLKITLAVKVITYCTSKSVSFTSYW